MMLGELWSPQWLSAVPVRTDSSIVGDHDGYLSWIVFLPAARRRRSWRSAQVEPVDRRRVSVAVFALSGLLFAVFDRSATGLQFVEKARWIPQWGISYFLGVDGISLPMVVLTGLLTFVAVLVSWKLELRPKEYFALLMVLETAMLGVFASMDLLLFFLFWELELAPMYLLIGIWGGPRREYAAMKFILYTMAGSVFMLVGIFALYFASGQNSFDMTVLGRAALRRWASRWRSSCSCPSASP